MWISAPTPVISSTNTADSGSKSRPITKAATTVPTPSRCPHRSVRRPPSSRTAAPASGSAMSSQDAAISPSAGAVSIPGPRPSVLEQVGVVDRRRPAGPEERHDDRQADDDLGGGDDHDEERHDLAVDGAAGT